MEVMSWLGWAIAAVVALCWWYDHRGKEGIWRDLKDARDTVAKLKNKG
jgi:hypothetical protein